jgi:hypothetical protein
MCCSWQVALAAPNLSLTLTEFIEYIQNERLAQLSTSCVGFLSLKNLLEQG